MKKDLDLNKSPI